MTADLLALLPAGPPASMDAAFLRRLLAGITVNFEIAALAMVAGLACGLPLAALAGTLGRGRQVSRGIIGLLRAAPTFVVMFFLLNVLPPELRLGGVSIVLPGTMIVALSLLPYAAAYVADNAAAALTAWRAGDRPATLLLLPNLARAYFVLVMSSGAGAAIGVVEGISVILRAGEMMPPSDRAWLFALGIACFAVPLQVGFLAVRLLRGWLGRPRPPAIALAARTDAMGSTTGRRLAVLGRPAVLVRIGLPMLVAGLAAFAIWRALPPPVVTIEAGPQGGSYHQIALRYRELLQRQGIAAVLRPNPDSLAIIDHVDDRATGVDIGFTAQALDQQRYPETRAAGAVQLQPLFLFLRSAASVPVSLPALRGLRWVMPPERSATSQAALAVLQLFGIGPDNTPIRFLPIADAVAALRGGAADVGAFMLDPANGFVGELLADQNLRLLAFNEGSAVTRHLPFLRLVVLPHGSFAIDNQIPPEDVTLLAATVNVVVRRDLHPAVLYGLLEAMKEVHHAATLVSDTGSFPSVVSTDLVPHPLAVEYARTGMPWVYRNLPPGLASLFDAYLLIGIGILVLAEVLRNVGRLAAAADRALEAFGARRRGGGRRGHGKGSPARGPAAAE